MDPASIRPISMTRRALAAGAVSCLLADLAPGWALADDALASGQFRDKIMAFMKRARPDLHLIAPLGDPALITIGNHSIYLNNLYLRVSVAPPEDRETIILDFISAMAEAYDHKEAETFEAARARLRARLVSVELVRQSGEGKLILATRPFSAKARIAYVVDSPQTMEFVSKSTLEKWSVDVEAIHSVAIENLEAISRDVRIEAKGPPGEGLLVLITGKDGYSAARLLAPKFMARMSEELGPEYYVGAPARDLLMAWSVDCAAKALMAKTVANHAADAYPVTDELFVWSDAGVRPMNATELAEHGRG
jgi:uncharacterized protein YtpQ (UPF0354 family)